MCSSNSDGWNFVKCTFSLGPCGVAEFFILLWWGLGRGVVKRETRSSWVTSSPSRRLNTRLTKQDGEESWATIEKDLGLGASQGKVQLSASSFRDLSPWAKPWFPHYTMATTPSSSGHHWHLLGGLGNMSTHGSKHTGLPLHIVAHFEKHSAAISPLLHHTATSKRFRNILIRWQVFPKLTQRASRRQSNAWEGTEVRQTDTFSLQLCGFSLTTPQKSLLPNFKRLLHLRNSFLKFLFLLFKF